MRDHAVRPIDAVEMLGMATADVYLLIRAGDLDADRDDEGLVWVLTESIDDYRWRQGASQST